MKTELVAMMLALLLPFHLEWEMPQLAGIKVGTTSLLVGVGLTSIIFRQFLGYQNKFPRIPCIAPWTLMAIFMCAAYIHSPYFSTELAKMPWHLYRAVLRFLLVFPLLFLLLKLKGEQLLKKIITLILFASMLSAMGGIIQTITATPFRPFHHGVVSESMVLYSDLFKVDPNTGILRAFGSFTHPNAFAGYLVISLTLTMGIILFGPKDKLWYLAIISGCVQIIALLFTMSRGGWVAFSSSFLIMASLARQKKIIGLGLLFLTITIIIMPSEHKNKFASRAKSISKPSEVQEFTFRQKRWEAFFEIAIHNPIVGTGSAVLDNPNEAEIGRTPHNMYLYFAVQNGIPALVLLAYFMTQLIWRGFNIFERSSDRLQRTLGLGLLGAGIGLVIHGAVDALIGLEQIWTAFWMLLAMAFFLREKT
ncbi:MAG: O-antigen ligase family protein [candidate division KSB1 bacterium]|nr:O-antigen ligase family protein [candidate division KSB1 bacterium]MDZ7399641.1 O-antigen ligase family protein [candidate division KSB1 bacterium]